jgi:1-hydroxy-2-naphthoate dioxygenase
MVMAVTKPPKTLDEFSADLAQRNLRGQWQAEAMLQRAIGGPAPAGSATVWTWENVHSALVEACEVMPRSDAARRNIGFQPPGFPIRGTTHTIACGMQIVLPGEVAWAHRHTLGALRFGIEGSERLYTVVDGEPLTMLPGDLVLTPNWTWHDHHNDGNRPGIWLDVLDVPLVAGSLNQLFFEPLGETVQPQRSHAGEYVSERAKLLRPAWERRPVQNFPFRYAWRDVEPLLDAYASAGKSDPYDGILLEYVNPMTGGFTLPTLGCALQLLLPGFETRRQQTTASVVYHVIRGKGATIVGDRTLEWGTRDSFVVPNWAEHSHVNRSADADALLFRVSDEPVLSALGLSRCLPFREPSPLPMVPAEAIDRRGT